MPSYINHIPQSPCPRGPYPSSAIDLSSCSIILWPSSHRIKSAHKERARRFSSVETTRIDAKTTTMDHHPAQIPSWMHHNLNEKTDQGFNRDVREVEFVIAHAALHHTSLRTCVPLDPRRFEAFPLPPISRTPRVQAKEGPGIFQNIFPRCGAPSPHHPAHTTRPLRAPDR